MRIRPATEGDYAGAARLFRALMGPGFVLDAELFAITCGSSDYVILVAEASEEVVGMAVVVTSERIRLAANTRRRRFHVDQLIVLPEHRRKGIGRSLLVEVVRLAREQAPAYIIVNCDFTDVAARKTYESAGFCLVRQNTDRFEIALS